MSIAPASAAGGAAPAAPPAAPASPETKKIETVPSDVRRRVLGMRPVPPETPEEKAAKEKTAKEAEEKRKLDEAELLKKKQAEEEAARAAGGGTPPEKVKKVKAGPKLPEKPPPAPDGRSIEQVVRDVLPQIHQEGEVKLKPEEEAEVELARFAEKQHPDRYTGFADKVKGFYSAHDEHRAAKASELGGVNTPEFKDYLESDEYKGWVREHRPAYARGDREKLREDAIADRARAEARREMAPELKKLERQTAELRHMPVIKARVSEVVQVVITDPNAEKDPALEGFSKDPAKFGEAHPEEASIIAAEAAQAADLVEEVYKLDLDLVDFNPKAPTQRQAEIRKFVVGQNSLLREQFPTGMEMKDGKILIDADTYRDKGLSKDSRYRVFSADEIAGMIAADSNAKVLDRLKRRREGITKSVYAPKPAAAPAAPSGGNRAAEDDPPAPAAGSRAAPGTAVKPKETKSLGRRYA